MFRGLDLVGCNKKDQVVGKGKDLLSFNLCLLLPHKNKAKAVRESVVKKVFIKQFTVTAWRQWKERGLCWHIGWLPMPFFLNCLRGHYHRWFLVLSARSTVIITFIPCPSESFLLRRSTASLNEAKNNRFFEAQYDNTPTGDSLSYKLALVKENAKPSAWSSWSFGFSHLEPKVLRQNRCLKDGFVVVVFTFWNWGKVYWNPKRILCLLLALKSTRHLMHFNKKKNLFVNLGPKVICDVTARRKFKNNCFIITDIWRRRSRWRIVTPNVDSPQQ